MCPPASVDTLQAQVAPWQSLGFILPSSYLDDEVHAQVREPTSSHQVPPGAGAAVDVVGMRAVVDVGDLTDDVRGAGGGRVSATGVRHRTGGQAGGAVGVI